MRAALVDTLFPPICLGCRRLLLTRRELPLCSRCRPELAELPTEARRIGGVEAVFAHEGPLRGAVAALKYGGQIELAGPLAALMARAKTARVKPGWEVVVPVPLHRWRVLQRGYNQTELLARHLLDCLNASGSADSPGAGRTHPAPILATGALRRVRATRPQTRLSGDARRRNLVGAIAPGRAAALAGRRVLVIDDVTTTGATLQACMAAARQAGAARVGGLALLRALS